MPSVGRKFLVAGHGGLNLTHSEELDAFAERYEGSFERGFWTSLLGDFSNTDLRQWAQGLGIETFIGTSGRVFPKEFKAAPLLRAWVKRLRHQGVTIKTRSRMLGLEARDDRFSLLLTTPEEPIRATYDSVILAMGGASWPQTGSDGAWIPLLKAHGLEICPLLPANCGWDVNWNQDILSKAEGHPLKNLTVSAGEKSVQGELLITRTGLEGGALYQLGSTLRRMELPMLLIDLKPSFSAKRLSSQIANSSVDFLAAAAKAWRLSLAAAALLRSSATCSSLDPLALAGLAKRLPIPLTGPRPIAEAISSAGGVSFKELDDSLMVKRLPGLFLTGEMLDWEAPTGGYLLQGCFATGTRAAQGAVKYLLGER